MAQGFNLTFESFVKGISTFLPLKMAVAKCKSRKQWPFSTLQSCVHDFVTAGEKPYKVRMIDGSLLPSEFDFESRVAVKTVVTNNKVIL